MSYPKRIKRGERIPIRLTGRDRDVILNLSIGGDVEERIRSAVPESSSFVVELDLDDLDELLGYVSAEANHCKDRKIQRYLYGLCERLRAVEESHTDEELDVHVVRAIPRVPRYTPKQGQYLSFIHYYSKIHGIPPAEVDLQRYFKVSPPAVHQMIQALSERGFIDRVPGKARTIRLLLSRKEIPDLE